LCPSPFLNEINRVMRRKHMSRRTKAYYLCYILDFVRFHGQTHREVASTS